MIDRKLSEEIAHAATQKLNHYAETVVITPEQCAEWADRVAEMEAELAAAMGMVVIAIVRYHAERQAACALADEEVEEGDA